MGALLPGDLVFFATNTSDPGTIHHVGMYVGKGLMVHAPHTGDVVRVASVWRDDYAGAVRPAPKGR
jgi:cell wall-associated NlpC family hydrolase